MVEAEIWRWKPESELGTKLEREFGTTESSVYFIFFLLFSDEIQFFLFGFLTGAERYENVPPGPP